MLPVNLETLQWRHMSAMVSRITSNWNICSTDSSVLWQREIKQSHYSDVIMTTMASKITSLTVVYSHALFRRRLKKTSKLRVTGICAASNAEMFPFDDAIMYYWSFAMGIHRWQVKARDIFDRGYLVINCSCGTTWWPDDESKPRHPGL